MRVFFSKAAIWMSLKSGLGVKRIKNKIRPNFTKQRKWVVSCHILLTVLAISVSLFYLIKIYDVPLYTTEFQLLHEGLLDSSNVHISIVRNYDNYRSDNGKFRDFRKQPGGIKVEGVFYNKTSTTHSDLLSADSLIYNKLEEVLDTVEYDYRNNLGDFVYLMIRGKSRQFWGIKHGNMEKSAEYYNDTIKLQSNYYHYGIMNVDKNPNARYFKRGKWIIPANSLFIYAKQEIDKDEYYSERFIVNSNTDSVIPVFQSISGDDFRKPNPLSAVEDVSKLVEIIRIPPASARNIKSLTIDYVCPTEFGTLLPEPDLITYSAIRYTDPKKLNQIAWNGLEYHAKFPDMENFQEIRLFAITTIITILITLLFSLLYKLIKGWIWKKWRKHPKKILFLLIILTLTTITFLTVSIYLSTVDPLNFNIHSLNEPAFVEQWF